LYHELQSSDQQFPKEENGSDRQTDEHHGKSMTIHSNERITR